MCFLKFIVTYPTSGPFIFMLCLLIFRLLFSLPFSLSLIVSRAAVALWSSWLTQLVVVHNLHWFSFPCYRTFSGTVKDVETSGELVRLAWELPKITFMRRGYKHEVFLCEQLTK